jgi:DNA-binding MarR family transcriptional regulator
MAKLRTANLLGALALEVIDRLGREARSHPNETTSAAAALHIIGFYEGCSNGALSRALRLSHPATVRLVDKLEAAGLVVRGSGSDQRSVALRLTGAGRARAQAVVHDRCVRLGDFIDVLSNEQRAQFDAIAETLLAAMVAAADDADHICRLCDDTECPPDQCPVHQRALALAAA